MLSNSPAVYLRNLHPPSHTNTHTHIYLHYFRLSFQKYHCMQDASRGGLICVCAVCSAVRKMPSAHSVNSAHKSAARTTRAARFQIVISIIERLLSAASIHKPSPSPLSPLPPLRSTTTPPAPGHRRKCSRGIPQGGPWKSVSRTERVR